MLKLKKQKRTPKMFISLYV